MDTAELLPIVSGLLLGSLLGYVRPGRRCRVGAVAAIALGAVATIVSGEFQLSWGYLLVDIPLVAISAAVALVVVHRYRWAH